MIEAQSINFPLVRACMLTDISALNASEDALENKMQEIKNLEEVQERNVYQAEELMKEIGVKQEKLTSIEIEKNLIQQKQKQL